MSLIKPDFVEKLRLQRALFHHSAGGNTLLLVVGRTICDCDD